jgi:hypothetical protein
MTTRWYDLRHPETAGIIAASLIATAVVLWPWWVSFVLAGGGCLLAGWLWRGRARVKDRVN